MRRLQNYLTAFNWSPDLKYARRKQKQRDHATLFVLHAKKPQQRPITNHFLTFLYDYRSPTLSDNIRATRLNHALLPATGNPKRISRDHDLKFRTMQNHEKPRRPGSIEQEPIYTPDKAFSSLDRKWSPPSPVSRGQPASAVFIPDIASLPQVCNHIRQIVAWKVV